MTISELRKAGWTCTDANAGKRGFSAYWTLRNAYGFEFEVDLGEARRWIVSYNGGRDGFDAQTLREALDAVAGYTNEGRPEVAA